MRALLILMMVLSCLSISPGCDRTSASSEGDKLKLGFIVKQPEEPWFQLEWRFAEEAGAKYGFEVIKLPAPDSSKALSAIDNLAAAGAKGFVICTPSAQSGPAIKARADKYGMKLISVDDRFIGSDGKPMDDVCYLGISAALIGEDVGKALSAEMKKRNWDVSEVGACVITFDELDTAKERTDGAVKGLTESGFPADKIFKAAQKTSDQKGSFEAASILLTQQPGVKKWLVAGMNDSAVMGAVRAMEQRGFNAETLIGIGINGTEAVADLKRDKATGVYGSMLLQARKHGYDTAEMLYLWVAKNQAPESKDVRTRGILITRDNYKQVLSEQGIPLTP